MRLTARGFALERTDFSSQPVEQLGVVFHRGGHRALAERHLGARGVEHADGFVGQLAAADVTRRKAHGLGDGFVDEAHVEVLFHQRRHTAQHGRGNGFARLFDLHHLKAPRQGRVFLEVLLVLAPRGGGHGAQLAAGERGFEQVGGIALAGLAPGADHRVRFVDEQDDRVGALLDLVDHILQAVLELALHARAGLQQAHVERVQLDALQRRRHITGCDAQCEPLDHRRLAHPRLAGEDRVVLAPPHQDVDHLPDLGLAADHRVELPGLGAAGEVGGELVERGGLARCVGGGALLCRGGLRCLAGRQALGGLLRAAGRLGELVLQRIELEPREEFAAPVRELRKPGLGEQREQQVRAADARVVRLERGDQPRMLEQRGQVRTEDWCARVAIFETGDLALEVGAQRVGRDVEAPAQQREIAFRLLEQREKQVLEIDFVVAARHREAGRALGGQSGRVVELADQRFEVGAHQGSFGLLSLSLSSAGAIDQASAWMS